MINQYFNVYALRRVRTAGYATDIDPMLPWTDLVILLASSVWQRLKTSCLESAEDFPPLNPESRMKYSKVQDFFLVYVPSKIYRRN